MVFVAKDAEVGADLHLEAGEAPVRGLLGLVLAQFLEGVKNLADLQILRLAVLGEAVPGVLDLGRRLLCASARN